MGDISVEPSMEEILSSIKRIIAEEGDSTPGRPRRNSRATPSVRQPIDLPIDLDDMDEDEILELSDPMPMSDRTPSPRAAKPTPEPAPPPPRAPEVEPDAEPIVSRHTAAAARAPLEALSRLMVKPDSSSDGTLEGLVRDMLRPMLREWIDANVPAMVEDMVAREIKKITGQA